MRGDKGEGGDGATNASSRDRAMCSAGGWQGRRGLEPVRMRERASAPAPAGIIPELFFLLSAPTAGRPPDGDARFRGEPRLSVPLQIQI
jgi:hypothetical protein